MVRPGGIRDMHDIYGSLGNYKLGLWGKEDTYAYSWLIVSLMQYNKVGICHYRN